MAQLDLPLPAQSRAIPRDRSVVRHVDLTLALTTLLLAVFGLLLIYSATHRGLDLLELDPGLYLKRQLSFLVVGLVVMAVVALFDYRIAKVYAPFIYLLFVLLLVLVQTPLGVASKGAQRWFQIGGFQFSPSLFTRISLTLMLAAVLSEVKGEVRLGHVARATVLAVIPMVLVFIQPDIGSSIILGTILVALLIAGGAKVRHLLVLSLLAAIAVFAAFRLHIIEDWQIERLTSFLNSSADTQEANYNRQQAMIAVGSGQLTGWGYLQGPQTNLDFVPEQHTDFIFTVAAEEFGFVGSMVLLALFAILLWRAFRIALLAKDPFGTLIAVGVAAMIAIQMFVNVGMTIGIMPITGIPLPFVSYGGSALVADFIGMGLLQSVHMRRSL